MNAEEAVQEYQCPGCVNGAYPECRSKDRRGGVGCGGHCPGTMMSGIGTLFLGMEKRFGTWWHVSQRTTTP